MATNITQDTVPYIWTSANDDIIYTFTFKQKGTFAIADDGNGFCEIVLISPLDVTPSIGDYVFLDNPNYFDSYRIKSITSTSQFVLDTAYIAPVIVYTTLRHLRVPVFSLYKGYKIGEGNEDDLPYTLESTIKPIVLYDDSGIPYIEVNVKGIVSNMFTYTFFSTPNATDYSLFNGIRLVYDGVTTEYTPTQEFTNVLNSAITNDELKFNLITYGFFLTPIDKAIVYTQGFTFLTDLGDNGFPTLYLYINGVKI